MSSCIKGLLVLTKYNKLSKTGSVSPGREMAAERVGYLDGLEGQYPILPSIEDFQDGC